MDVLERPCPTPQRSASSWVKYMHANKPARSAPSAPACFGMPVVSSRTSTSTVWHFLACGRMRQHTSPLRTAPHPTTQTMHQTGSHRHVPRALVLLIRSLFLVVRTVPDSHTCCNNSLPYSLWVLTGHCAYTVRQRPTIPIALTTKAPSVKEVLQFAVRVQDVWTVRRQMQAVQDEVLNRFLQTGLAKQHSALWVNVQATGTARAGGCQRRCKPFDTGESRARCEI